MNIFNELNLARVRKALQNSNKVVIVAHKSPDGDSIGSSLGLFHYLKRKGFDVTVCHPDPAPHFLHWLSGADEIVNAEEQFDLSKEYIQDADLIFCLDFNSMSRVGKLEKFITKASATKVMIDHHLNPSDEFDISFSDPKSCSTAQLIIDFIEANEDIGLLNEDIGEPLYCGIMTDTGSFRFPSVTPHTHEVVATLMKAGVKSYKIHEAVFDTNTVDRLKLRSFAIHEKMEFLEEHNTVLISLTQQELKQFNSVKGDTEGLVNIGLSIQGITKSIFLKEDGGIIKISFRSKGQDNPVNMMANNYFQGGGHANASGGKWEGSINQAIAEIKRVLPEFD